MTNNSTSTWDGFKREPATKTGKWAVGLALASVVLLLAVSIMPGGGWPSFLCGLLGGALAIWSVARHGERSWLVFLAVLPMVFVILFLLAEVLSPH